MDLVAQEAISALDEVIGTYLPAVAFPAVSRNLLVFSKTIKPIGIGDYIGLHAQPQGDLRGRYIEAQAEISVSAVPGELAAINDTVQQATTALLTNDRSTLRQDGVFGIELIDVSQPVGLDNLTRTARFNVRFEYIKVPETAGDMIAEIALKQHLNPVDYPARFLVNYSFPDFVSLPDPLANFESVDDPDTVMNSPAGRWEYNGTAGRIEQLNSVRGGGLRAANPIKAGAQLLIQPDARALAVADFSFCLTLSSQDRDGIGCVFRWLDPGNYYYFLMSSRKSYRMLGKKVAGSFAHMDAGGLNDTIGFDQLQRYQVKVLAIGTRIEVFVNDVLAVSATDDSLSAKGQLGLFSHANNRAYFHGVDIVAFDA